MRKENEKMKPVSTKKLAIIVISFIFLCGSMCLFPYLSSEIAIMFWNRQAPETTRVDIPPPYLLYKAPSRINKFSWELDASHVHVHVSNWTKEYPDVLDTIVDIDLETNQKTTWEDTGIRDVYPVPEVIKQLGLDTDSMNMKTEYWTRCIEKDLIVAEGFGSERFWLKYWQNEELVETIHFTSEQWPGLVEGYEPIVRLHFSPSCDQVALISSGWFGYESLSQEELWLLDIPAHTFERVVLGKTLKRSMVADYPVQDVDPDWSPDEEAFVFGSGEFGIEVYDLTTSEQRTIVGPKDNLYHAKWSPSGEWIAAIQRGGREADDRMYVLTPDGSKHSFTKGCERIEHFRWSPEGDRIVYVCSDDSVWLWELK